MAQQVGATFTENVRVRLSRLEKEVQKHLLGHLEQSAEDIAELARLNVPVKDGSVEASIVVEKSERSGMRGAHEFDVGVDRDKVHQLRRAKGIDRPYDYFDVFLHESVYNLGEKSVQKDFMSKAAHPKARVGNKYLERAWIDLRPEILAEANLIVRTITQRANRR